MGVNFNEIDFVLSCNGKDLVNKEFQEDTENFVVTFVQKYYDFIYKENEKKNRNNHWNITLYKELMQMFPDNNRSLLYKHIKECIEHIGDEVVINVLRNDVFKLQSCKNISEKTYLEGIIAIHKVYYE